MFARKWHCFSDDYEAVAHPITIEIAHGHLGVDRNSSRDTGDSMEQSMYGTKRIADASAGCAPQLPLLLRRLRSSGTLS